MNFPDEEATELVEAQWLRKYAGMVGYIQLGFVYQGIVFLHETTTEWYERFQSLLEDIESFPRHRHRRPRSRARRRGRVSSGERDGRSSEQRHSPLLLHASAGFWLSPHPSRSRSPGCSGSHSRGARRASDRPRHHHVKRMPSRFSIPKSRICTIRC